MFLFRKHKSKAQLKTEMQNLENRLNLLEQLLAPPNNEELSLNNIYVRENMRVIRTTSNRWEDISTLKEILGKNNINLRQLRTVNGVDGIFDYVAAHIGANAKHLAPLMQDFKFVSLNNPEIFSIRDYSEKEKIAAKQLCSILYNFGFLSGYSYLSESQTISLTPARIKGLSDLLHGKWLERWVEFRIYQIIETLRQNKQLELQVFPNVVIEFPNGVIREIDIVAILNGEMYWFECKTGAIEGSIRSLEKLKAEFGLEDTKLFIVSSNHHICTREEGRFQENTYLVFVGHLHAHLQAHWTKHFTADKETSSFEKLHHRPPIKPSWFDKNYSRLKGKQPIPGNKKSLPESSLAA